MMSYNAKSWIENVMVPAINGKSNAPSLDEQMQGMLDQWYTANFPGGVRPGGAAPAADPMQLINPMYTRQQQSDVDPIAMYRTAKETGVIPQSTSSFQPYTPPPQKQSAPVSVSRPVFNQPQSQGGK